MHGETLKKKMRCVWSLNLCKNCCNTAFHLGYTAIKPFVSIFESPRIFALTF